MPATLDPSSLCRVRCRQPPGLYAGLAVARARGCLALGGGHASVALAPSVPTLTLGSYF
jgi:hypothetical protein